MLVHIKRKAFQFLCSITCMVFLLYRVNKSPLLYVTYIYINVQAPNLQLCQSITCIILNNITEMNVDIPDAT